MMEWVSSFLVWDKKDSEPDKRDPMYMIHKDVLHQGFPAHPGQVDRQEWTPNKDYENRNVSRFFLGPMESLGRSPLSRDSSSVDLTDSSFPVLFWFPKGPRLYSPSELLACCFLLGFPRRFYGRPSGWFRFLLTTRFTVDHAGRARTVTAYTP